MYLGSYAAFSFVQWKVVFSVIKILLTLFTVIVLLAAFIQGASSYRDYCSDEYDYTAFGDNKNRIKRCDFSDDGKYAPDVEFAAVVVLSGAGTLFWVSENGRHMVITI